MNPEQVALAIFLVVLVGGLALWDALAALYPLAAAADRWARRVLDDHATRAVDDPDARPMQQWRS